MTELGKETGEDATRESVTGRRSGAESRSKAVSRIWDEWRPNQCVGVCRSLFFTSTCTPITVSVFLHSFRMAPIKMKSPTKVSLVFGVQIIVVHLLSSKLLVTT